MLVEAQQNDAFFRVLQQTSLNIPDGIGLILASHFLRKPIPERITGIDTMIDLVQHLSGGSIFLLGAAPGVAERAAAVLVSMNPSITIAGTCSGSPRCDDAPAILAQINRAQPTILFVAFGAPAQECWIAKHLSSMPSVRLAMGVGGAFDFLAGVQHRAPRMFQVLGLEWLWRLLAQPWRWKRIFRAVVVFPWKVLIGSRQETVDRRQKN